MEELCQGRTGSSYRVIDNPFASLWAGYVLDLETVVGDFLYVEQWDYKSFKEIAERRGTLRIQRSTFSQYPLERCQATTAIDKRSKGRFSDQLLTYKALMEIIFNATKAIWLETHILGYSADETALVDLKRNVCGLYLLYYMWHNQVPDDPDKVFINFTRENEQRKADFFDRLEKLSQLIPEPEVAENCCKYAFSSLEKRNALYRCFVADEPKLSFHFWEYLNLRDSLPRMVMTQISSRCCKPSLAHEVDINAGKLMRLLREVEVLSTEPVERSILLRKILPKEVLQQLLLYKADDLRPTSLMLPLDYKNIAASVSENINKNLLMLQSPFLSLDGLMKSYNASKKLTAIGKFNAESTERRSYSSKLSYKQRRDQHDAILEINNLRRKHRAEYRGMDSPAWNFLRRDFDKIFKAETNEAEAPDQGSYDSPAVGRNDSKFQSTLQAVDTTNCFEVEDALTRRKRHRKIASEEATSSSSIAPIRRKRQRTGFPEELVLNESAETVVTAVDFVVPGLLSKLAPSTTVAASSVSATVSMKSSSNGKS